jgi:CRP-like cAMP-binding protein
MPPYVRAYRCRYPPRSATATALDDTSGVILAREDLLRVLADLEPQGAISVGRRHIAVNEPELLRKQARF